MVTVLRRIHAKLPGPRTRRLDGGPAAWGSWSVGAVVALLVAMPGAEAQVVQPAMRVRVDAELAQLRAMARETARPPTAELSAGSSAPAGGGALDVAALPEPLRRYVAYTRLDPRQRVRLVRIRFQGEVRLPQTGDREAVAAATPWMALSGTQTMVLSAAGLGYVWDTRWTNPRFAVDVRDRYVNGQTHIWALRDDGQVLMDEGDASLARTYLIRFFAEATQAPAMLMPGPHLRWEAVDAHSARAHMRDGAVAASMLCRFDAEGALTQCESGGRLLRYSGEVRERWIPARWVMVRGNYKETAGLRLPTTMSIRWVLPGGEFEQVRESIDEVLFDEPGAAP